MNYILTSIRFIKRSPSLLLIFIILNSFMTPFQMLKYMGELNILVAISGLILGALGYYLMAGLYSCIWKTFSSQSSGLRNIIKESNHYFPTYLLASIVIGLIGNVIILPVIYVHKTIFYSDFDGFAYGKQFDATLVRFIPGYIINIIFAFILPAIYVASGRGFEIIKTSLKFIVSYFPLAIPVIILKSLDCVIGVITIQYAVTFDYASIDYWNVIALSQILLNSIELLTFITAVQIFKDNFRGEETHNKSLERTCATGHFSR